MRPVCPMGAMKVRAAHAFSAPLIALAVLLCSHPNTSAHCTPPCSGPAVPTSRVESDIPGIGAWSSVAICECDNFVIAWRRWVEEEHEQCPPRIPNVRGEVVAQGYYPDGDLFWQSLGILSVEPSNQCHIFHGNVSVAMSRNGTVWASWIGQPSSDPLNVPADPELVCAPIMLQTGFAFDGAPGNITPQEYPIDPCLADNEYWPSSGVSEAANVVAWSKTNDLNHGPRGLVQQIAGDTGTISQVRDCNNPWPANECNFRVLQWQPSAWMREPDESDFRSIFAVAWAEPESEVPQPTFNIAIQVWDANSNVVLDELTGPASSQWVNQPADEANPSEQTSPAVCFAGDDIIVTWVGRALPIDEFTDCPGGDRIFARRFKFRNNQIVDPDPQAGEGQPGMFIVDGDPNATIIRAWAHPTVAIKAYPGSVGGVGNFIVAWNASLDNGTRYEIRGAYFDPTGAPLGRELRLNQNDGADNYARLARSGVHTVAFGAEGQVGPDVDAGQ